MSNGYVDHLQVYMTERAKRFVKDMGGHYPSELLELKEIAPLNLIRLLEEGATPVLRSLEGYALDQAAMRAVVGIRWAKRQG